jgi:hypothetical protein
MINAIIFSKDRAQQLRLLFDSMFYNSYKLLDDITVIYTCTDEKFAQGYSLLQSEKLFPKVSINWIQEENLVNNVISAMTKYCKGPNSFITFFTDDSVFYKNIQPYKFVIESCMHTGSDISCFSLRLGINTTEQVYWHLGTSLQLNYSKVGNIIKWHHADYPDSHGYGYPLSLDGHIFRADEITNLVSMATPFSGVNSLEGSLSRFKSELAPSIASFEHSALVVVPINRVQDNCPNVAGLFHGISPEELNSRYLAGEVIDYKSIDFSSVNGTHQELRYQFRRK